ncbi:hypothetical protein [Modicisalibacter sp. 'Wilcox']|uniref:COG4648 family protein n=1 Tax=Modicisalibacter sp. 'Wilcox' TaxID=2679914 RepID=UPI0013D5CF70|nr:hypothetical protein [Modicisalibacter sp. 'Wilcox']
MDRPSPARPPAGLLIAAATLAWPWLVTRWPLAGGWPWLVMLVGLAAWRLPAGHRHWAAWLGIPVVLLAAGGQASLVIRLWPVLVNAVLLGLFARSLRHPPSAIERLARRRTPDLPPSGVRYTYRVTQLWCAFFAVNGTLALATVIHGDPALWSLYNGGLAYLAMALLFAGEWLVRQRVKKRASS